MGLVVVFNGDFVDELGHFVCSVFHYDFIIEDVFVVSEELVQKKDGLAVVPVSKLVHQFFLDDHSET